MGGTADKGVFWLVPLIANFFFGVGYMLIFGMATTMLTEFMPKKASIGVALVKTSPPNRWWYMI